MPPRINLFNQALAYRPRTAGVSVLSRTQPSLALRSRSYATDPSKDLPVAEKGEQGPNMQQQEHVSEEAAKMAAITGGEGPDLSVGTPVQELLEEDKEAQKHAPQVLKESINKAATPAKPQTRPFSTYARRSLEQEMSSNPDSAASSILPSFPASFSASENDNNNNNDLFSDTTSTDFADVQAAKPLAVGHKYPLPALPLPSNAHKEYRYDPVVNQVTHLLMKDGKLAQAQSNMAVILRHLRTSPAPTYSPGRPLMPGAPPSSHLPLNPTLYLTLALDSVSPLLRIRSIRGAAGGGAALQVPVPLGLRQRRRQAFMWILDAASKRKNRGSGRNMFATRVAEEIVSVIEGKSSVWERRLNVHKLGTAARINVVAKRKPGGR